MQLPTEAPSGITKAERDSLLRWAASGRASARLKDAIFGLEAELRTAEARLKLRDHSRRPKKDLTDQRFGHLVVLSDSHTRAADGSVNWLCRCDCGAGKIADTKSLRSGSTRSCGCLRVTSAKANLLGKAVK